VQVNQTLQKIGSDYGGYFISCSGIGPHSIIYSLGLGEDISFDLGLIHRFGVSVHAFDPTPRVKTWLQSQNLPEPFHYQDVGIADFDGEAAFYLPAKPNFISHSIVHARQYSEQSIRVPMIRLSTAMRRLGHMCIDILKMDIEGAEYVVLEDIVREEISINQIVVEFHHRLSGIGAAKTKRVLSLLEGFGMKIGYVCPRMEVFTLLRAE
jgi:FkbM family methyltransferase